MYTSWSVSVFPAGAQVPITSYTCTQPDLPGYNDDHQCTGNISTRFRTCEIEEVASSDRSIAIGGLYGWRGNKNPFMVLDIPQGWCVGSVEMTFQLLSGSVIPTLSLSLHSAERLSSNTDRTGFSTVSAEGSRQVVLNLTPPVRGRYLRIDMTSAQTVYLQEIEVLGTSRCTSTEHQELTRHVNIIANFRYVLCPPSQMIASVRIHPQLVAIFLAQPPHSAHLLIQSHLSVSAGYFVL